MVPRLVIDAGLGDFLRCARSIMVPWRVPRGDLDERLTALVRGHGAERVAVAGLSLRTLFDALLQVMRGDGAGDILFSAATIDDMPALALANGFRAVPVDVRLDTMLPDAEAVVQRITRKTRALVVAQLYGCRGDLSGLAKVCRENGVLVVEDIAQSFDGSYLGSPHADIVLMSFGPIKRFTAFGGGILLATDPHHADAVKACLDRHPVQPCSRFVKRAAKMLMLRVCASRPLYGALWSGLRLAGKDPDKVIGMLARGFSGERPAVFRWQLCSAHQAFLALRLEKALTGSPGDRARRAHDARIRGYPGAEVPGRNQAGMGEWIFPVIAAEPDKLVAYLNRRGFDATRGTTSMRAVTGPEPEDTAGARYASHLLGRAVYLPIHSLRSEREFDTLSRLVAEADDHPR